ncbi:MAG: MFS transporter [Chloroflexota bacterium]|nr:MFS transporter [Chloroflexota bacterium]MDE2961460.1 MFS transporter [Chloroflexota bacterium]
MFNFLKPRPVLTEQETRRSLRYMGWGNLSFGSMWGLGSGGMMAAYALALGANNLQVGILAALPFIAQVTRLPTILLVERFRARKAVGWPAFAAMQLAWLLLGLVPLIWDTPGNMAVLMAIIFLGVWSILSSTWAITSNTWLRDLVPPDNMASFFGRRLARITIAASVVGLAGSFFVRWWEGAARPGDEVLAFSFLLIGGVCTFGIFGPFVVSRVMEPMMPPAAQSQHSPVKMLLEPVRDPNYSRLLKFLFVWSVTSNLAIPFFAVYMLKVIGLSVPTVMALTVLGQFSNVLFVRVWGGFADRVGSKTVLSLSASLYLLVIIGWVFTTYPERYFLTMPLLVALHLLGGAAASGVTLTLNTLSLKVAPEGQSVPFSGVAGMITGLGAGIGPVLGGLIADYLSVRSLDLSVIWSAPGGMTALPAVSLSGFEFLFGVAFVLGLLSLNLLVPLREEGEISRDDALAELMAGMSPVARAVSSVPGLNMVSSLSYGYLRHIPGADVAIGVTAYQLAASTQAAVVSADRGRAGAAEVAHRVGAVLGYTAARMTDTTEYGLDLARHATRGAVHAAGDITEELGSVTQGAMLGTLRTLSQLQVAPAEALRGAAHGVVQGAVEAQRDLAGAVEAALAAARTSASELGITDEEAAAAAAAGIREAAQTLEPEDFEAVISVLPESVSRETDADSTA